MEVGVHSLVESYDNHVPIHTGTLITPHHTRHRALNPHTGQHLRAQLPRLLLPRIDRHQPTILQPHRHQILPPIDLELPRETASRGAQITEPHLPIRRHIEGRERVRRHLGHVLRIRVRDREERGVAVTHEELLPAADDGDFRGRVVGEDGGFVVRAVGLQARDLAEGEPRVQRLVRDRVAGDRVGELGDEEEVVRLLAIGPVVQRPEHAVARSRARSYGDGGFFGDLEGGVVDVEHAHEIGAQIGDQEIFVRGVEDDLVRMWCCLPRGVGPGLRLREVEGLGQREGGCVRLDGVGSEAEGVVRDGEQLLRCGVVARSVQCGVYRRGGRDGRLDFGELAGVGGDFEGDEGAIGVDDAFVEAEEVLVDGVDG